MGLPDSFDFVFKCLLSPYTDNNPTHPSVCAGFVKMILHKVLRPKCAVFLMFRIVLCPNVSLLSAMVCPYTEIPKPLHNLLY